MSDAPSDPRCPECGEPIGQTASYCMHCSTDLSDRQPVSAEGADESGDGLLEGVRAAIDSLTSTRDEVGQPDTYESGPERTSNPDGVGQPDTYESGPETTSNPDGVGQPDTYESGPETTSNPDGVGQPDTYEPTGGGVSNETGSNEQSVSNAQSVSNETGTTSSGGESTTASDHPSADVSPDTTQLLDPDSTVDNALTVIVGIIGGIVVGILGTIVLGALTASGWAIPFGLLAWLVSTAYIARQRSVQGAVAQTGFATAVVLITVPVVAISPFGAVSGGLVERASLFFSLLLIVAVPAAIAAGVGWIASQVTPEEG